MTKISEGHVRGRVVYAVEAVGVDLVKIGWTSDLAQRLRVMSCASPCELRVLRVVQGGPRRENELHRAFAEHRVRGEWFRLSALRSAIESLDDEDSGQRSKLCACGGPKAPTSTACRACSRRAWKVEHACVDCGASKSRKGERCRACATALRPRRAPIEVPCVDCGRVRLWANGKVQPRARCQPCAMVAKWATPEFRATIMPARAARRKPCAACGLTEPKVGDGAKYHPECWARRATAPA